VCFDFRHPGLPTQPALEYRALAEARPEVFLPDLAMSLNNQAPMLSEVGRRQEALEAITEAVTHYRQLADASPAAFAARRSPR